MIQACLEFVATGLGGLAMSLGTLLESDGFGVFGLGFGAGGPYDTFANVPSCDTLTAGPGGSVITGQFRPLADGGPLQIRQAFPDGGVRTLAEATKFAKPQGVAYDKTNKRLFVADSNGTTVRTIKIVPVD